MLSILALVYLVFCIFLIYFLIGIFFPWENSKVGILLIFWIRSNEGVVSTRGCDVTGEKPLLIFILIILAKEVHFCIIIFQNIR